MLSVDIVFGLLETKVQYVFQFTLHGICCWLFLIKKCLQNQTKTNNSPKQTNNQKFNLFVLFKRKYQSSE